MEKFSLGLQAHINTLQGKHVHVYHKNGKLFSCGILQGCYGTFLILKKNEDRTVIIFCDIIGFVTDFIDDNEEEHDIRILQYILKEENSINELDEQKGG